MGAVSADSDRECVCGHARAAHHDGGECHADCDCPTFFVLPEFADDPVAMALGFTTLTPQALRVYSEWAKRKDHTVLASLLTLAADEIDRLRSTVEAIAALHVVTDEHDTQWCNECELSWPCRTARALTTPVQPVTGLEGVPRAG